MRVLYLFLMNSIIIIGYLSPLWYPKYYLQQTEIWTAHIVLLWPFYNYLFYLRNKWDEVSLFENVIIGKYMNRITWFISHNKNLLI